MQLRSSAEREPKVVHVIRHGQAEHNVDNAALEKRDTQLTALGVQQAAALRNRVSELGAEVIVTSPILRALQTTSHFHDKSTPVVVVPDLRERVSHKSHLCELPVGPMRARASGEAFASYDWAPVDAALALAGGSVVDWESGLQAADLAGMASIGERAARLTQWLEERSEGTLVVVSHGAFLMRLTSDSYMQNCELRTYSVSNTTWTRRDRLSLTNTVINAASRAAKASGLA